jgi:hypothetical protein
MLLSGVRYYWMAARGFRLRPWASPYLRWRLETYFGPSAASLDAAGFCRLLWRERARLGRFLSWANERRRAQRHA